MRDNRKARKEMSATKGILLSSWTTALKKKVISVAVYLLTLIEEIDEW
jgi:hypothetical protein